jgi:hypothetical protein
MPRETIFTPYSPDPDTGDLPFQITVGWHREAGEVQVGVETVDPGSGRLHLVDYVYGDTLTMKTIGELLTQKLAEAGLTIARVDPDGMCSQVTFDNDTASYNGYISTLGRSVLDAVTGSTPFGNSVWSHLRRTQINDLIKLLRRARDGAFGKDE